MTPRSCDESSSPTTRPNPCPEARYPARELTGTGALARTGAIPRQESLVPTVLPGVLFFLLVDAPIIAPGYHSFLYPPGRAVMRYSAGAPANSIALSCLAI